MSVSVCAEEQRNLAQRQLVEELESDPTPEEEGEEHLRAQLVEAKIVAEKARTLLQMVCCAAALRLTGAGACVLRAANQTTVLCCVRPLCEAVQGGVGAATAQQPPTRAACAHAVCCALGVQRAHRRSIRGRASVPCVAEFVCAWWGLRCECVRCM